MENSTNICNNYSLADIQIGMEERFTVKMTEAKHNAFTEISGDVNPIHLDDNYAYRGGGIKGV